MAALVNPLFLISPATDLTSNSNILDGTLAAVVLEAAGTTWVGRAEERETRVRRVEDRSADEAGMRASMIGRLVYAGGYNDT